MSFDPVTAAFDIGSKIIDKIWPDPVQAATAKLKLFELQQSGDLAVIASQSEINKIEANSGSLFVAGWRPFIGWVCGIACAWNWCGISIANTVCTLLHYSIVLKPADISEMMPVLIGMLGLGGMRTVEKLNSIPNTNIVGK
jgi:hypothetical protein